MSEPMYLSGDDVAQGKAKCEDCDQVHEGDCEEAYEPDPDAAWEMDNDR